MKTKTCVRCKKDKPLDSFSIDKRSTDGIRSWCRECTKAYSATWRKENQEYISIMGKRNYASKPPEYSTWCAMKGRCNNPNHENYKYYGGKGISLCPQWSSFDAFLADVGSKPTPKHQLHREDSGGNYEPGNCLWVTMSDHAQIHRSITPNIVGLIKRLKRDGVKQKYIAAMSGASEAMVSEIVREKRYKGEA